MRNGGGKIINLSREGNRGPAAFSPSPATYFPAFLARSFCSCFKCGCFTHGRAAPVFAQDDSIPFAALPQARNRIAERATTLLRGRFRKEKDVNTDRTDGVYCGALRRFLFCFVFVSRWTHIRKEKVQPSCHASWSERRAADAALYVLRLRTGLRLCARRREAEKGVRGA